MMLAFDVISAFPFQIVILFFVTIDFTKFLQILEHYYFFFNDLLTPWMWPIDNESF